MHHTYTVEGVFETTQITSQLQTDANIISWNIALLFAPLLSKHYLLVCLLSMSTVFSSGHGNEEDWLSRTSRKCCEDNRMCPGSAAEGRRIQGSYCTLWNGLRNAKCLPFFFSFRSGSYHMLEATGFEDNVTPVWYMCVTLYWHTDVCGHPPPHSPPTARRFYRRNKTSLSSYSGHGHRRLVTTAR